MSMDHLLPASMQTPDSPFIEGTQIQFAWDSVSLTSMLSCPRRYQYQILWGLVPNSPAYAIALVFGILFHKGVEVYHKERIASDHDEAVLEAVGYLLNFEPATAALPTDESIENMKDEADDEDDGITFRNSKIRTRYYLIRALVWYLEHFKDDPCQTLLLPSGAPAVEVSFRVPMPIDIQTGYVNESPHQLLLCGHIDRGIRFNNSLYVSDYKTTKSITSQWRALFELSHQLTGYTAAGKIIWEQPVRGTMIDGIALQVGQVKFNRHFTDRTQGQIEEYIQLLGYVGEQAVRHHESGDYPMNTAACYFCDFKGICSQPPEYRAGHIKSHYSRKPGWNPLLNR